MANNTYDMVMSGKSDNNIRFTDFRNLILFYGFVERIKGSHHVYKRNNIPEGIVIISKGNKRENREVYYENLSKL